MGKLYDFVVERDDFITSDKIFNFCQGLNKKEIQYIKTDFLKYRRDNNMVFVCGWRNLNERLDLSCVKTLVTGHSDYDISNQELEILNMTNMTRMFSQNVNIKHPKLFSLPIGITNKDEPNSRIHEIIGNTDRIYEISKTPKKIKNLAYMNITISNFPRERQQINHLYGNKNWVTVGKSDISEKGHYNFLSEIYEHKFCFAPRGNGIDTHRLWESLYLRTIPIVKKCLAMEQFYDLPILFVDDWDNITEDFLNKKYEEIINKKYPLDKLKINYWLNLISS